MRALTGLLLAIAVAGGCASAPPLPSTMTLAPGQAVSGCFEIPGGGEGWVQFHRQAPRRGVMPWPEALTWTGDGKVLITFVDEARVPESPLGFASWTLKEGRPCRVVLRNVDTQPASFDWIVKGSPAVVADWDVSGGATAR
jgi:hypothetical protein